MACDPLEANITATQDADNGLKFDLEATATGGRAPYTYTWNFGDGSGDQVLGAETSVTYATSGEYTITLLVTDAEDNTKQTIRIVTATGDDDPQVPTNTPVSTTTQMPTETPINPDPTPTEFPTQDPDDPTPTEQPTQDPENTSTPVMDSTSTPEPLEDVPEELEIVGDLTQGTIRPEFRWGIVDDAEWYNLAVIDQNGNSILDIWLQAVDICNATWCTYIPNETALPVGLLNGSYTWAVRSWGAGVISEYSSAATFTVEVPAAMPPSGFSVDSSTGRPVITLPNDPATTWMHIWIGLPDFSETLHLAWYEKSGCNETTCVIVPDVHPLNGTYAVYIQTWGPAGYNAGDALSWTGAVEFMLDFPPAALITPLPTLVSGGQVALSWNAAEGATWYQVWVGTADYTQTLYLQWQQATDLSCPGEGVCSLTLADLSLSAGQTYSWWVQSWGPGGIRLDEGELGWQEGSTFNP